MSLYTYKPYDFIPIFALKLYTYDEIKLTTMRARYHAAPKRRPVASSLDSFQYEK